MGASNVRESMKLPVARLVGDLGTWREREMSYG